MDGNKKRCPKETTMGRLLILLLYAWMPTNSENIIK
jgi:hypothetical protein